MSKDQMRWIDALSKAAAVIAAVIAAAMALHIVVDAISRSMFNNPLSGTLEITQYLTMPAVISLSLGYAMLRGEHIRVDLLTAGAGARTRQVVEVSAMFLALVVMGLVAWAGIDRANASFGLLEHSAGSDWVPIWPGRSLVAIGLVVLVLQIFAQLVRAFRNDLPHPAEHAFLPGDSAIDPVIEEVLHTPKGTNQ
jgi:TRAP-type C4-dicarboxylate transport system permease small subunit